MQQLGELASYQGENLICPTDCPLKSMFISITEEVIKQQPENKVPVSINSIPEFKNPKTDCHNGPGKCNHETWCSKLGNCPDP